MFGRIMILEKHIMIAHNSFACFSKSLHTFFALYDTLNGFRKQNRALLINKISILYLREVSKSQKLNTLAFVYSVNFIIIIRHRVY